MPEFVHAGPPKECHCEQEIADWTADKRRRKILAGTPLNLTKPPLNSIKPYLHLHLPLGDDLSSKEYEELRVSASFLEIYNEQLKDMSPVCVWARMLHFRAISAVNMVILALFFLNMIDWVYLLILLLIGMIGPLEPTDEGPQAAVCAPASPVANLSRISARL